MSSIFKDFGVNARADAASLHDAEAEKDMTSNRLVDAMNSRLFKRDCLDRKLERHHVTGMGLPSAATCISHTF